MVLKLSLIFVLISLYNAYLTDPTYMAKYDRLYNSEKYNTKVNYKYAPLIFKCNDPISDCSNRGTCSPDSNDCICDSGYTTLTGSYKKCTYQMKSYVIALVLETFISFGVGHLYVGNYTLFVGKFLFFFFSYYFNFCVMIFVGSINQSNVTIDTYYRTKRTFCILVPMIIGWYIFDVVMFACMQYKDQNGIELKW
jgi:hypothetical protein